MSADEAMHQQQYTEDVEVDDEESAFGMVETLGAVLSQGWRIAAATVMAGAIGVGVSFLVPNTYTARTVFMPPQQQQSAAMAALGSLGSLASLAGGSGALKSPGDQFVALLQTRTVSDRMIERFKLLEVYDERYRVEARRELTKNVRLAAGKKDGLITVEVDDRDPSRAAGIANAYVEELRKMTADLAISEAQQRRRFFEQQLARTRDALAAAQVQLERSGFSTATLRAEPKAAAEGYAKLKAELQAAEVRLQVLRNAYTEETPEVQRQLATVSALRGQLASVGSSTSEGDPAGYISKYREFKYQETLFELFSRQYELARVDEAREGALIQVVEPADVPEKKSRPKRSLFAIGFALVTLVVLCVRAVVRKRRAMLADDPEELRRRDRWRAALNPVR